MYNMLLEIQDMLRSRCQRSFLQVNVASALVLHRDVQFSAVDQYGRAFLIDNQLALRCGYSLTYDGWRNIDFRASLLSCYTQIKNDSYFTVVLKIDITNRQNAMTQTHMRTIDCPYEWQPREIICETNYMEVSVRRKIPMIAESAFQDEPEDWSSAFPEAVSGLMSIWQVVFHLASTRKAMLVKDAQDIGYGINTTESRIILRSPYNANEAQLQRVSDVGFSTVRATVFYKQRWVILLVDTAVACPVDDVTYANRNILWTVPKNIPPLLVGASAIKNSRGEFGIDLTSLTDGDLLNRNILLVDNSLATSVTIPYGAVGGYYKSHTSHGEHGITYNIKIFLENQWEDNRWGVTKYTIIKDITTPFDQRPPIITNDTIPFTKIFNVTIGTFLPDVELVNLTIGPVTVTVPEGIALGYTITPLTHPNGSKTFILKVPFSDPNVKKEYIPDYTRVYTLNVTFGFHIFPTMETFEGKTTIIVSLTDAVPPNASGDCKERLTLRITRGNVDMLWVPYIKDVLIDAASAQLRGFDYTTNKTHFAVSVPRSSDLISYDEVSTLGLKISLPLTLRDATTGHSMYEFNIQCTYPAKELISCSQNGTMAVIVMKLVTVPDMDLSRLHLRARDCTPAVYSDTNAKFIFNVNTCETTRRFTGNTMIYENDVLYYMPGSTLPAYQLKISCTYTVNNTVNVWYSSNDNPKPGVQITSASLVFVLRLSKGGTYSDFYGNPEYPVVQYLKDPLYFEVELMHSSDPQLELFLENCWATTSTDRGSLPRWDVVVNSCEFLETHNTVFHPVNVDSRVTFSMHLKRFEVKMFTFMQADNAYLGEIYFHCAVIICNADARLADPLCSRSCIPEKQRVGRSLDSNSHSRNYVSSGAVRLALEPGSDTMQAWSHLATQ
uniref:ZP domain-containing protein n=1 Tax=Leptobrachium leishanense TaxID=445787 RepID=A0A8C5M2L0_9ANUR